MEVEAPIPYRFSCLFPLPLFCYLSIFTGQEIEIPWCFEDSILIFTIGKLLE